MLERATAEPKNVSGRPWLEGERCESRESMCRVGLGRNHTRHADDATVHLERAIRRVGESRPRCACNSYRRAKAVRVVQIVRNARPIILRSSRGHQYIADRL